MPEGDTLHQAAERVDGAIGGERILRVQGSHRAVRREGRRLVGASVERVEALGKHLLVHVSSGWTLRTHLGMTGSWHVYAPDQPWRITPGKARVVLVTPAASAVCFAAPHVDLAPTGQVMEGLERIGPDLALRTPAFDEIVVRARRSNAPTVADLLLDQGVASGVGNVYKSEVLFLQRLDPGLSPRQLDDDAVGALYRRANRLLLANVADPRRTTTGSRGRERTWVYGRGGRPCRRCGTTIAAETHGPLDRVSYWCPACQGGTMRGEVSPG